MGVVSGGGILGGETVESGNLHIKPGLLAMLRQSRLPKETFFSDGIPGNSGILL